MGEPAPLFSIDGAVFPEGTAAFWYEGADGARLRAALVPTGSGFAARGSVIVSPGRSEPIEKYVEVVQRLTARGFVVLVHDWRGQGLSHRALKDRLLGHAQGYAAFLWDFRRLLDVAAPRLPGPWIALGHSMGGCLTLLAMAEGEDRFAGAFLSAPMLGMQTGGVPRPLARALSVLMPLIGRAGAPVPGPRETAPTPFADNILTHDAARYARFMAQLDAAPDLLLGLPTWGWLDFAFRATARLATGPGVPRLAAPVRILTAGEERLVDNAAAARIAARLPRARLDTVEGAYHELFQETDPRQAEVWSAFDALLAEAGV